MKTFRTLALLSLAALLALSGAASATITFTQLDDDVFTVSHRVKGFGSRGKATKLVYEKAASLCVAAGYSHYSILDQESQASQEYESANATVRVKFFFADGDDRIGCHPGANPEYVEEAGEKLAKQGYVRAEPSAAAAPPAAGNQAGMCGGECSLEQIAAMARAGLTDEQIRAACSGSG